VHEADSRDNRGIADLFGEFVEQFAAGGAENRGD